MFRSAVSAVIRSIPGFWVMGEAHSGEEAIRLVAEHAPALVLLDVGMPGLDGVATARLIADINSRPITVLVSADENPEIAADPRAHGAAAFLSKRMMGPGQLRELWAAHRTSAPSRDNQTPSAIDINE